MVEKKTPQPFVSFVPIRGRKKKLSNHSHSFVPFVFEKNALFCGQEHPLKNIRILRFFRVRKKCLFLWSRTPSKKTIRILRFFRGRKKSPTIRIVLFLSYSKKALFCGQEHTLKNIRILRFFRGRKKSLFRGRETKELVVAEWSKFF